jgi:hypothetical protein
MFTSPKARPMIVRTPPNDSSIECVPAGIRSRKGDAITGTVNVAAGFPLTLLAEP